MANKTNLMDSLKDEAVRVYSGMITVFPQFSKEEVLNVSDLVPKFNGCYSTNNSTVCFVSENEIFVTPATSMALSILEDAGFRQDYFYVPFSNWDYPKFEKDKWDSLLEKARKFRNNDFVKQCVQYCDEHHIGTISNETLMNCCEVPSTGVKVKLHNFHDCYYPIINSLSFDSTVADRIGHFCTNNGKVVFVYRNGKTYVTKGYKILDELRSAGYIESGLFVPFSNGEQILDSSYKARWDSITK